MRWGDGTFLYSRIIILGGCQKLQLVEDGVTASTIREEFCH